MARPGDGEWQHAEVGARAGTARLAGRGGGRAGRAGPDHQLPGRAGSSGPRGGEARGGRAVLAGRRSLAHALSARRLEPLRGGVGGGARAHPRLTFHGRLVNHREEAQAEAFPAGARSAPARRPRSLACLPAVWCPPQCTAAGLPLPACVTETAWPVGRAGARRGSQPAVMGPKSLPWRRWRRRRLSD